LKTEQLQSMIHEDNSALLAIAKMIPCYLLDLVHAVSPSNGTISRINSILVPSVLSNVAPTLTEPTFSTSLTTLTHFLLCNFLLGW